jgi:hypothetical protein
MIARVWVRRWLEERVEMFYQWRGGVSGHDAPAGRGCSAERSGDGGSGQWREMARRPLRDVP